MFNIKEFNAKKEKGLARVVEVTDENVIVAFKKFDLEKAAVGELVELPEEVQSVNIAELNSQKVSFEYQVSDIVSFLAVK